MRYTFLGPVALILAGCAKDPYTIEKGENFGKRLQEALVAAKAGVTVKLPEGRFEIDRPLSLTVAGVSIKGAGIDKTVLSFKNQSAGAAGLLVTGGDFLIEDLAIEDTKGDALKINGVKNVTVRRVRVAWTGGPSAKNGPYGIYPVRCENVLVEDSVAIGSSDAGVYVGQSKHIIVRRNRAEQNVVGLEIENSEYADAYENVATGNTGGFLVVNLPGLPVKNGKHIRVYNNKFHDNNLANFAPPGNIVAKVPKGTGLMILAANQVEVFGNTIENHATNNLSVISYVTTGNPTKDDQQYDPFNHAIYVHDNKLKGGGNQPEGLLAEAGRKLGGALPEIIYDGVPHPKLEGPTLCVQNNGDAKVLNLDAANNMKKPELNPKSTACTLPALAEVKLGASTT
jgi:parallel beta-helix repeat protein